MKPFVKRALAAAGVVGIVAGVVPLLTATPASAAGTLVGSATIKTGSGAANLQSGNSATTFTLRPTAPECPGDSTNDDYRWQGYMVSGAIDPSTLRFGSAGPNFPNATPNTGTYATFQQPLYTTTGSPVVNQSTADRVGGPGNPGPILSIPDMNFAVHAPGDIPPGVYNVGIACTLGPASATQMSSFWNVKMTITTDAATGGPAQIHWENGTSPDAPTLTVLTPGTTNASTGQISAAFTNPAANPALTSCTFFVGTSAGGTQFSGPAGTAGSCTSPFLVTGLTYGQAYFVRMTSTNVVGTSVVSNELNATAIRPAVTGLSATPSPNTASLNWDDAPLKAGAESYNVAQCTLPATNPCTTAGPGYVGTTTSSTSDLTVGSLVPGQQYAFTVTYGAVGTSLATSVGGTPLSNTIILQDLTVGRPNGALVLTQVCGKWDAMGSEVASEGFPTGIPASSAAAPGLAPTLNVIASTTVGSSTLTAASGPFVVGQVGNTVRGPSIPLGTTITAFTDAQNVTLSNPATATLSGDDFTLSSLTDPQFGGYPYPDDATTGASTASFPTHCGVDLGVAKFVDTGSGAGKYFATSARLNQVTVTETRDADTGWTVNFQMSDFTAGAGKAFSGNWLGYTLQRTDTGPIDDANTPANPDYDQAVAAGFGDMAPNTLNGAGTAHSVATALAGSSLGISTLDARLKLLIPVYARTGNYAGQLTINAV